MPMKPLEKKEIVKVDLVDSVIEFYCNRQTQFL